MSSSVSTDELSNSRKVNFILNQLLYYDKEDKKNGLAKNYIENGYFDLLTICDQKEEKIEKVAMFINREKIECALNFND